MNIPRLALLDHIPTDSISARHGGPMRLAVLLLPILLGACAQVEKQGGSSPLSAAGIRLARAEKQSADKTTQAAEYLSVAEVAQQQLTVMAPTDATRSSALRLYNRAAADLAADLPALIERQPNSKVL